MYQSLEEIRNTIISSRGSEIVYLYNIAEIYLADEDSEYHARFNGERAVFVTMSQKDNTNIFQIMNRADRTIGEFEESLPRSMQLHRAFDQSQSVSDRFDLFFSNLAQGIVLVGIIVFLGVGLCIIDGRDNTSRKWASKIKVLEKSD